MLCNYLLHCHIFLSRLLVLIATLLLPSEINEHHNQVHNKVHWLADSQVCLSKECEIKPARAKRVTQMHLNLNFLRAKRVRKLNQLFRVFETNAWNFLSNSLALKATFWVVVRRVLLRLLLLLLLLLLFVLYLLSFGFTKKPLTDRTNGRRQITGRCTHKLARTAHNYAPSYK